MKKKYNMYIIIIFIVLFLTSCGSNELPTTWYLDGFDYYGGTLELQDGKAFYRGIEEFEGKEFEYTVEDDVLVLTSIGTDKTTRIELEIRNSYDIGKYLIKDDSIYAYSSKEVVEQLNEEYEKFFEPLS